MMLYYVGGEKERKAKDTDFTWGSEGRAQKRERRNLQCKFV